MRFAHAAVFLCAAVPAAAFADPPAPAVADGNKKVAQAPDKLICRTFDTTGSRLNKRRECRTSAQWQELAAYDRREVEKQQANRYKGNE